MALRAEFDGEVWSLYEDDKFLLDYSLDLVSWDYILDVASRYGVISSIEKYSEQNIPDRKRKEILEWFKTKYWPTELFGYDLIRSYEQKIERLINEMLGENLFEGR